MSGPVHVRTYCGKQDAVLYLCQAFEALDAQREQLLRFQGSSDPVLGWLQVPLALLAPEQRNLLLDAFCDVHLGPYAVDAHVGGI